MTKPRRPGDRDPFIHDYRELLALFPHFRHTICNPYTDMSQSDMDMQAPQPWFHHEIMNNSTRPIQYVELRLNEEVVGYAAVDTHNFPDLNHRGGATPATGFEVVGFDPASGKTIRFKQEEVTKSEFNTFALSLKAAPVFSVYDHVVEEHFCCGVKVHIPEGVLKRTPSVDKEGSRIRRICRRIRHLFQRFR